MWDYNDIEWVENKDINNSGGIITFWRKSCFQMLSYVNGSNYNIVEGMWKIGAIMSITIVIMYYPGSLRKKRVIWVEISEVKRTKCEGMVCGRRFQLY